MEPRKGYYRLTWALSVLVPGIILSTGLALDQLSIGGGSTGRRLQVGTGQWTIGVDGFAEAGCLAAALSFVLIWIAYGFGKWVVPGFKGKDR